MRVLATLLVVGAVLAVLRLALVAFALALLLLLTYGAITRPARTLALVVVLALLGIADSHRVAFITSVTVVAVAVVVAVAWRKAPRPLLLVDRR